jgi:outer membrane protein OmpA-like peptidoglycan-associated protein
MGNRVLTQALEAYAEDYLARADRREIEFRIVLAAADVERDVFDLVADQIVGLEPNVTIYTSDNDLALGFSRLVNRAVRLGETNRDRPYIRLADGYATIDATQVASELFGIGHGYYSDNPFILNDIRCALFDVPAESRALATARYAGEANGSQYFLTLPDLVPIDNNCALRRQYCPPSDEPAERPPLASRPPPEPTPPPPPAPPPPPPPPPVVTCPTEELVVYFDWGRSDLTPQALANIDATFASARHCEIAEVLVVGHADTSGSSGANVVLSQRRASVVRDALVGRGIVSDIIRTEARGESAPMRSTPDDAPEALNRRVEITIRFR